MTVVNDETLDAIGRAIKSLTSPKGGVPSAEMLPNTITTPDRDNNNLENIDEIAELAKVPTDFIPQNKRPHGFVRLDKMQQMMLSVFLNCRIDV